VSAPSVSRRARGLTRRQLLGRGAGAAAVVALGAYGLGRTGAAGGTADFVLRPAEATVELGRRRVRTFSYGDALPGPEIRLREGDPVRVRVDNALAEEDTSVHWHGIALANEADGVPGMTQDPIGPGDSYLYEFTPPDAGTYLYHSHVGMQLDRGLYGPLIVEPRREELAYDAEAVLMLDDWLDGIAGTPDAELERLRSSGMAMGGGHGSGMPRAGRPLPVGERHATLSGAPPPAGSLAAMANELHSGRGDPGDVRHPLYLVNGRPPEDPPTVRVRRGERLRLRLVNPSADTIFCLYVDGHPLTVTHADGQRVEPVETDALVIGMGERYDVLVEARGRGVQRIVAVPLGKPGRALALLRYADARPGTPPSAPPSSLRPRRTVSYEDLRTPDGPSPLREPETLRLDLAMTPSGYGWTIGGQAFADADPIELIKGQQVRFVMRNATMMPHPMHLHGHFFRPTRGDGRGPLKDTLTVPAMTEAAIDWVADNPGTWAYHCHNAYHQEAGMMRRVEVGA
jgi:FtsP/CotA-like multicopper oxidase with cupredoxin domain